MAKTNLFRMLKKLLRDAKIVQENKIPASEVEERMQENIDSKSRREFLKQSAIAGAAVAGSQIIHPAQAFAATVPKGDTVAILGAGAAGLAAAYRLKKAGIPFHIYEAQSRVGGRLWTKRNFNSDGQFVELGGELVDSGHETIMSLVKELFPVGQRLEKFDGFDKGYQQDIYFSNGRTYSRTEIINSLQPFLDNVNVAIEELFTVPKGEDADDYLTYETTYKFINMQKYDNMTIREFLYSSHMLRTVDRFILDFVNVCYLAEYGRETDEQPSINLLYLIGTEIVGKQFEMFGYSDEAYRIKGGSDRLTTALQNKVSPSGSDVLRVGHKLTGIRYQNGRTYLRFNGRNTESQGYSQVICTIPFSVLTKVDGLEDLAFSAPKKLSLFGSKNMQPFGMGYNSKSFLTFKRRLWREDNPGVAKNIGALYGQGNFPSQCFWESSRVQAGTRGVLTNYTGGDRGLNASDSMIPQILGDLDKVYKNPKLSSLFEARSANLDSRIPNSKYTVNWSTNPLTRGSYGCVMLGQWSTMVGALGQSELNKHMFFAGEHTSLDFQGYMEGGFESGTRAAGEVINSRK
jgi:monoamine oxidase